MGSLDDRVALVTGSMSGIGRAIAERFAAEGARVIVNSRTAPSEPVVLAGREAVHLSGDVGSEADVLAMIGAIDDRFGALDVLVNSAGATKVVAHDDLDGITVDDWNRILGVNVVGAWNTVKAAAPLLRRSELGDVVNVSSMAGVRVTGSSLPYSVSKAALNQLTRTLAKALGPEIRVNAVAPGFIETPWTAGWGDRRREVLELSPLARVGTPEDVADAVMGLLGARFVTGEILLVDGGLALAN